MLDVVGCLRENGYEALLAGGCVRDMLLGKKPNDYDVATNATPETVTKLFKRTLTVGAQFGVVVVLLEGRQVEVATFRSDQSYQDGRRPEKVVFTDARHDAQRRDFTINGMFYDPLADRVIDYVGGKDDLREGVVRAIGSAERRFEEDHLRMLRAIRFAGRLDFQIEQKTFQAIRKNASKLKRISIERVAVELEYILADPHRKRGLNLAYECGLLENIFPSLGGDNLRFGIKIASALPKKCSFALALAALLINCDGKKSKRICRDLKTSNELRSQVSWLISNRQVLLDAVALSKGRLKQWLAEPLFETLLQLAIIHARLTSTGKDQLRTLRKQIADLGDEPLTPPRLLDGHDLIKLGAVPGPLVGQLAEELYLAQLENHVQNRRQAETWVKKWLSRHHDQD